jgi:hypothetical protein
MSPPPKREQYNLQSMHLCVVGQDSTYGVDRASDVLSPRASLTQTRPPRTNPQKSKIFFFLLLRQNTFFRFMNLYQNKSPSSSSKGFSPSRLKAISIYRR